MNGVDAFLPLRRFRFALLACALVILISLLTGCGGGARSSQQAAGAPVVPPVMGGMTALSPRGRNIHGPNVVAPSVTPTPEPQPVHVQLSYAVPNQISTSSLAVLRRRQAISPSNTQITIVVTPLGGSGSTYGPTACSTASCVVNFTALPGPNTIRFTLSDGTNTLSTFSTTEIVQPSVQNTLRFTANPVVNSVNLSLMSPNVNSGTAVSDLLTVNAKDAAGNTIVGNDAYVDANGRPVSLVLSVANTQAGGSGTVRIVGPSRITAPNQTAVYAQYDGRWLESSTISVASIGGAVSSLSGVTLTTIPTITEYSAGISASASPQNITAGPDGNLWFTECGTLCGEAHEGIGRITTSGVITEFSAGITAKAVPGSITVGHDGNLWFVECGTVCGAAREGIGRITPSGNITEFSAGVPASSGPQFIASGADGNLWFTECGMSCGAAQDGIGRITTTGVVSQFSAGVTAQSVTSGIASGLDGNLWFSECGGCGQGQQAIGRITPTGRITEITAGLSTNAGPREMTADLDGNFWFLECGIVCGAAQEAIGRVTPGGNITEFSAGISAKSFPQGIASGPDGNIWFTECGGTCGEAHEGIGRITKAGVVSEFPAGIVANAQPGSLAKGSDGNLWFIESGRGAIAKFVY